MPDESLQSYKTVIITAVGSVVLLVSLFELHTESLSESLTPRVRPSSNTPGSLSENHNRA